MRQKLLGLAGATTAGVLLTAMMSSTAAAEQVVYEGGTPNTNELVVRGSGSADADATATASGALDAQASAVGGRQLLPIPLPIPGTGPSGAFGYAQVQRAVPVAAGTYRITVTYRDAVATVQTQGGTSTPLRNTIAAFTCEHCAGGEEHVVRFEPLPNSPTTVRTTLLISIPDGESGLLNVTARILADANARNQTQRAASTAEVSGTSFAIERL